MHKNLDLLIELGTLPFPVPDDAFWEKEAQALQKAREASQALYKSLEMSNETFHRRFTEIL